MNHLARIHSLCSEMLKQVGWLPNPCEMFKAPSIAKGSPGRRACEGASTAGDRVSLDDFLLASRLEHLITIGGSKCRQFLFSEKCPLDGSEIAKLCRRMPQFIEAKLEELYAGGRNIDSNPTGAFDTNGWSELRVRLPKFSHSLSHYRHAKQMPVGFFPAEKRTRLAELAAEVVAVSDRLLERVTSAHDYTATTEKRMGSDTGADWSKAVVKFAQTAGVLRKTHRDLCSVHWRKEWVPTDEDLRIVLGSVCVTKEAADHVLSLLRGNSEPGNDR